MSSEDECYHPQSILITGGAGFIGSHATIKVAALYPNASIVVLDKLDYCAHPKNLDSVEGRVELVVGDITSIDLVSYLLKDKEIDTILHFAAQTHVDNSFGNSFLFTQTNVFGTHVLLEAARQYGKIKRFIHVSTDEVYGTTELTMAETQVLDPTNPYAATKAAAEYLVKSYYHSFSLPIIITRGNNVYGPHQYPEKLIPKFINLILRDRPCTIHGTGEAKRSFLYVEDVADAFCTLLGKGRIGQIYNIGTDLEITVIEVTKTLIGLFGKSPDALITYVEDRHFNDLRYSIDSAKLNLLGWTPSTSWEVGLAKTIAWYTSHTDYWPNLDVSLQAHPPTIKPHFATN